MKLTIYWVTKDESIRARIRKRFGIPWGMTVNKETKVEIRDEDMDLLRETEKRGFRLDSKNDENKTHKPLDAGRTSFPGKELRLHAHTRYCRVFVPAFTQFHLPEGIRLRPDTEISGSQRIPFPKIP